VGCNILTESVAYRVPTGRGKLEKVREFEWSGKVRERSDEKFFGWPGGVVVRASD